MQERWMVVGKNREPVATGLYSQDNARGIADRFTASHVEHGPFRVVRDVVAEELDAEPEYLL